MKKMTMFRLNEDSRKKLKSLADVSGKNMTEIVEYSIKAYHSAYFEHFVPVNTKKEGDIH